MKEMANAQILVVEDEGVVAMDIRAGLKSLGYSVPLVVSSGEEAIQKVAETKPDLVLMDIKLNGEMDGVQAAEQIRLRFNIPVIYLTSFSDDETLYRAKITEPYGYMLKPFDGMELHTNIEVALYKHQMERKLKESEEKYRSLVENMPDIVRTIDQRGNIIFISRNIEKVYGYTPEEIYNSKDSLWFGRIHPDDIEKVKECYESLFKTGKKIDVEYRIQRKDGSWIWLHDRVMSTYEKDGVMYANGALSDITERKQAEEML